MGCAHWMPSGWASTSVAGLFSRGRPGIRDAAGRWLSRTDTAELERRYWATARIHRADLLAVLCAAVPGESPRRGVTVSGVRPDGSVVHSPR